MENNVFFRYLVNNFLVVFLFTLFTSTVGCSIYEGKMQDNYIIQARVYLQEERYYDIISLFNEIDNLNDKPHEYHLIQGLSFFKMENYQQAIYSFEQSRSQSLQLQIYIAYLALLIGDSEKASTLSNTLEIRYGQHEEISLLKGNISLKNHFYNESEKYFLNVLAMNKYNTKAIIGLGNTYIAQRKFSKAEEYYLKAVFISKDEIYAYISLSNYYITMRRYEDAEFTILDALVRYPDEINLLMILSNIYSKNNKTVEAIDLLNKILSLAPKIDDIVVKIIKYYFELDRLDDGYQLIRKLLSRRGEYYQGLLLLGEYYLRKNDYELASFYFNKAISKSPNSYLSNYYLGVIHLIKNQPKLALQFLQRSISNYPSLINTHFLIVVIYIMDQKYDYALEHIRLILEIDPGNIEAHLLNGLIMYHKGLLIPAFYEFEVAELLQPMNVITYAFQTLVSLQIHKLDEARKALMKIDIQYLERLNFELLMAKNGITSKSDLDSYLEKYLKSIQNGIGFILLGNFYRDEVNSAKSEKYFKEAAALPETEALAHYSLAELEASRGNIAEAINYLQKVIELVPSFVKTYQALGQIYEQQKNYYAAKRVYEEGLTHSPEDILLLNNLAWVKLNYFSDKPGAYLDIKKALKIAPEDPDVQDTLAWWYYLNEDYLQAVAILKRIIDTYPHRAMYRYHLGMAYFKLGERNAALTNLREALDLGIDDEYKAEIMGIIK